MKTIDEIQKDLSAPFDPLDIEWRIQRTDQKNTGAYVLAYIDSRAVMNRLDKVVGSFNWRNTKKEFKGGIVDCIEIRNPEHPDEWVGKQDGADDTDVEPFKGALSDSMKRTGVLWGIGRYLYQLEAYKIKLIEGYKNDDDWYNISLKDPADPSTKKWYSWQPPALPKWAIPDDSEEKAQKLKLAKDRCMSELKVMFAPKPIPDNYIKQVDIINHDLQIESLLLEARTRVEREQKDTPEYWHKLIVKGLELLGKEMIDNYNTAKHKTASVKKWLGVDNVADCQDVDKLSTYKKHLLCKYYVAEIQKLVIALDLPNTDPIIDKITTAGQDDDDVKLKSLLDELKKMEREQ